jgi:hypothetical protein
MNKMKYKLMRPQYENDAMSVKTVEEPEQANTGNRPGSPERD